MRDEIHLTAPASTQTVNKQKQPKDNKANNPSIFVCVHFTFDFHFVYVFTILQPRRIFRVGNASPKRKFI